MKVLYTTSIIKIKSEEHSKKDRILKTSVSEESYKNQVSYQEYHDLKAVINKIIDRQEKLNMIMNKIYKEKNRAMKD